MGRYFGREPRLSREEIEAQAQRAIEAQVGMGRPPSEDWQPLDARLAEIDRVVGVRPGPPAVPGPRPVPTPVGATNPPA